MIRQVEHKDRRDIYEYVQERGRVDYETAREDLGFDPTQFGHHVTILKRDGLLREAGDDLVPGIEDDFGGGAEEEFTGEEVSFNIRPARQSDLSGLLGVIRDAVEDGNDVVAETIADILDEEQVLYQRGGVKSRVFFVATVNGDVIGWVNISHPELEKLSHTAELTVGVLPEYRRNGIGSHLVERGLEWAVEEGYERIYNSVPSTNGEAIAFLEAHGWEEEATREDHYRIDGEYVDEVMMAVTV
ncbi:GNAT family N-acetyltransferase [Halorubrum sp. 48-1-W]|uniref:GNAT family N-acetyltransferase n=1 Tax=Halorubrum sp. 48-1-W TaxID=2249761 RepID=UPI000DCD7DC5|nr:GNAT family N-acetyltransferase [Halorubrum sp. 48-1-W]RAW44394.1 GNAT family N-acetyltransferase [Halorubrum sp. 48-1-W]